MSLDRLFPGEDPVTYLTPDGAGRRRSLDYERRDGIGSGSPTSHGRKVDVVSGRSLGRRQTGRPARADTPAARTTFALRRSVRILRPVPREDRAYFLGTLRVVRRLGNDGSSAPFRRHYDGRLTSFHELVAIHNFFHTQHYIQCCRGFGANCTLQTFALFSYCAGCHLF